MITSTIPHFRNDEGCPRIEIGVKAFMCIGTSPPCDHPHIFLSMGKKTEKICPYCSTLYIFNSEFEITQSNPPNCFYGFSHEKFLS